MSGKAMLTMNRSRLARNAAADVMSRTVRGDGAERSSIRVRGRGSTPAPFVADRAVLDRSVRDATPWPPPRRGRPSSRPGRRLGQPGIDPEGVAAEDALGEGVVEPERADRGDVARRVGRGRVGAE